MVELLKSECPHCRQSVEFSPEGIGEMVPCPTCNEPFILTPIRPARVKVSLTPTKVIAPITESNPPSQPPLELAIEEFGNDPAFVGHEPTREQVARAWAMANFSKDDESQPPTHLELVAALKKLFREFKHRKSAANGSHSNQLG